MEAVKMLEAGLEVSADSEELEELKAKTMYFQSTMAAKEEERQNAVKERYGTLPDDVKHFAVVFFPSSSALLLTTVQNLRWKQFPMALHRNYHHFVVLRHDIQPHPSSPLESIAKQIRRPVGLVDCLLCREISQHGDHATRQTSLGLVYILTSGYTWCLH
ncbi:hypothetical protein ECG_06156 [Echinococcus granulosus]|uniref:Dynein light chain n=1 Tax=Echinococcus granulosus TaxID=6210 RepID=A0A068WI89_ECHGR|nr:hypothetical protein ECG_06156 [Echinococcus granulosus]CDS19772.1 hypothetical protein EgrG_000511200 [Echinococcus granulosus]